MGCFCTDDCDRTGVADVFDTSMQNRDAVARDRTTDVGTAQRRRA